MNWTGGGLTRVASTMRDEGSRRQKSHFANARAKIAAAGKGQPRLSSKDVVNFLQSQSNVHQAQASTQASSQVRDTRRRKQRSNSSNSRIGRQRSNASIDRDEYRLISKRQKLLEQSDWLNLRPTKPLRMEFDYDKNKENFGRRHKIMKRPDHGSGKIRQHSIKDRAINMMAMPFLSTTDGNVRIAIGNEVTSQTQRSRLPLTSTFNTQKQASIASESLFEESMLLDSDDDLFEKQPTITVTPAKRKYPPIYTAQSNRSPMAELRTPMENTFRQHRNRHISMSSTRPLDFSNKTGLDISKAVVSGSSTNHMSNIAQKHTDDSTSMRLLAGSDKLKVSSDSPLRLPRYANRSAQSALLDASPFISREQNASLSDDKRQRYFDQSTAAPAKPIGISQVEHTVPGHKAMHEQSRNRVNATKTEVAALPQHSEQDEEAMWRQFILGDLLSNSSDGNVAFSISRSSTPLLEPLHQDHADQRSDHATCGRSVANTQYNVTSTYQSDSFLDSSRPVATNQATKFSSTDFSA